MKVKTLLLLILLSATLGAGAGFAAARAFFTPAEKIVIKEIEKPVIKYIKEIQPTDTAELWNCYRTPIAITYGMQDATMRVRATDGCKETRQDIQLEVGDKNGWKVYAGIGAGALIIGGVTGLLLRR